MFKDIKFEILGQEKSAEMADQEGLINRRQKEIFPSSFVMIIVGKPGSGKTTIVEELLVNEEFFKDQFDFIFIFSPNEFKFIKCEKDFNWFNKFDINLMYQIIDMINADKYEKKINVLFILDDFIGDIKKNAFDPKLIALIFNRRHLIKNGCLSLIITTQKYLLFPSQMRSCINSVIFFQLNLNDYVCLKKDICAFMDFKYIEKALSNRYDFIFSNLENGLTLYNFLYKIF